MTSVYLVLWDEAEAKERAARLREAGYAVRCGWEQGGAPAREIRAQPPDAVVVDLGRLPSHGRSVARWLRETKATRAVPVVFVEGEPSKTAIARRAFPDCAFATWRGVRGALKKALAGSRARKVPESTAPRPAGYSGTPLPKKLGLKEGSTLALLGAPDGFDATLGALPDGVAVRRSARGASDVIVLFARSCAELARRFPAAQRALADGGGLWVAWPKQAAGVVTDLGKTEVREHGLAAGLVDDKVCAVDDTWSGLRFRRRRR